MPTDSQLRERLEQVRRHKISAKMESVRMREAGANVSAIQETIKADIYAALEGELLWVLNEPHHYRF